MKKQILVIDNYDSFTYNLVHYIKALEKVQVDVYRNDKINLEDIKTYDYIVLSPGPGLPDEAGILKQIIKTYGSTKKILGVCLGMQAIAEVYGYKLKNLDQVYHGISTNIYLETSTDPLFKGLPSYFKVGRYHSWIVENSDNSEHLIITSRDKNKQIMSITHKSHHVYGVQFHPESILTDHGKNIINNFISIQ